MKVFISGKITNNPNARADFEREELRLIQEGHSPLNPQKLPGGLDYDDYMHICYAMLDVSDAAYFIPGWESSPGSKKEYEYAKRNGLRILGVNVN